MLKTLDAENFSYQEYLRFLGATEKKYAPEILHYEGDTRLLINGIRVSVVGSRKASEKGLKRAEIITRELVKNDIIVVSGLAEGIDTMAHKTAIQCGGRTIAVLGTPIERAYPASNKELLVEIKKHHLAISQFSKNFQFGPKSFPMRNRTMALISDATIIVEANEKSGTRHQGWEALRLGRMLFIMQNIVDNISISWAKEMLKYGAVVLSRDSLSDVIQAIPNTTSIPTEFI